MPTCHVEGCKGDRRYAPPGRGHTCTFAEWMAEYQGTPEGPMYPENDNYVMNYDQQHFGGMTL